MEAVKSAKVSDEKSGVAMEAQYHRAVCKLKAVAYLLTSVGCTRESVVSGDPYSEEIYGIGCIVSECVGEIEEAEEAFEATEQKRK